MAIADSAGLPVAVSIADGSKHDVSLATEVVEQAFEQVGHKLIGDRGFSSQKLVDELAQRGIELIAPKHPTHKNRKVDGRKLRRYKRRWKVERLFAWLKRYRRISTRWDRKAENYLGFLYLGCLSLLVRHF